MAVHFKIDCVNAKGDISNYHPDFVVKKSAKEVFIVETKGLAWWPRLYPESTPSFEKYG